VRTLAIIRPVLLNVQVYGVVVRLNTEDRIAELNLLGFFALDI
jgi:hypothetical protein